MQKAEKEKGFVDRPVAPAELLIRVGKGLKSKKLP